MKAGIHFGRCATDHELVHLQSARSRVSVEVPLLGSFRGRSTLQLYANSWTLRAPRLHARQASNARPSKCLMGHTEKAHLQALSALQTTKKEGSGHISKCRSRLTAASRAKFTNVQGQESCRWELHKKATGFERRTTSSKRQRNERKLVAPRSGMWARTTVPSVPSPLSLPQNHQTVAL